MPTVPGIPAWGAVAVAVGAAVLGFLVDAIRGAELSSTFAVLYVLGAFIAVLAVRHRGLFTAMVQPPLIMFVGVPIAYQVLTEDAGTSIKDIILTVAVPLVDRFPLMLLTTLLVLGVGGARLALDRKPQPVKPKAARERAPRPRKTADASPRRASADAERARPESDRAESRSRDDRRGGTDAPAMRRRATGSPRYEDRTPAAPQSPPAPRRRTDDQDSGAHARTGRRDAPAREVRRPAYEAQTYRAEPYEKHEPYENRRSPGYEPRAPRRTGADNPSLTPYPAPRVRYRDRD